MHHYHRDSYSSVPLLNYYQLTNPSPFKYPATGLANGRLKKEPGEGTGPTTHVDSRGMIAERVRSRSELDVFKRSAKHQLNAVRAARFARPSARASLLASLFALLWIASPQAWSQTIAWTFTASNEAYSSPAIGTDGTIYFGSSDGRFYAVQSNGATNWSFTAGGGVISAPALASDETVYFGSLDGALYAVSTSGKLQWRLKTGSPIHSSPAVGVDGYIYVGSLDHKLYAVRPDGTNLWTFLTGGEIYSSPAVGVDRTIYVGSSDKRVYAIDRDGKEKWHYDTGGVVESSPAIGTDGTLYVGSVDAKVYAINPDGTKKWDFTADAEFYSSPAVGPDGTIYIAAHKGRVYALRPDGTKLWDSQATTNLIYYSSIALAADGSLYVGSKEGLLRGQTSGGVPNWAPIAIGPVSRSSPGIGPDGTIYVGSDDHRLYAINGGSTLAAGQWPMFRRDARHTGTIPDVFAVRHLPSDYSPGATSSVRIETTPLPVAVFWEVDETPPAGWVVSQINESGFFDAGSGTIRFGPFFDGAPRTFTYQVTSPLTATGAGQFAGTFEINFVPGWITGDAVVGPIPLHPADQPLVDAWMTVGEVTAYGAAWKRSQEWPTGPSPILLRPPTRLHRL